MSNNSSISSIQYASSGCTIVSSLLSIFGAVVIFWTYGSIRSIRNFPRTLLIWLTIADLLNASGNLAGTIDLLVNKGADNDICTSQSVVAIFASIASFLWTLVITAHMMVSIQFRSDITRSSLLKILYHVICWGIPGLITVLTGVNHALGRYSKDDSVTGTWCWINDNISDPVTWMLLAGKGWEIMCYILSISILVLLKLKLYLSRRRLRELNADFRDQDTHYLYLWLLLWVLRVWGTVRFILYWLHVPNNIDVLIILQSIGDSGQAFGNCILFCFLDKEVMEYIKNTCRSNTAENVEYEILISTPKGSAVNERRHAYSTL